MYQSDCVPGGSLFLNLGCICHWFVVWLLYRMLIAYGLWWVCWTCVLVKCFGFLCWCLCVTISLLYYTVACLLEIYRPQATDKGKRNTFVLKLVLVVDRLDKWEAWLIALASGVWTLAFSLSFILGCCLRLVSVWYTPRKNGSVIVHIGEPFLFLVEPFLGPSWTLLGFM